MRFDRFMAQRHKARGHTIFDNKNTNNRYSKSRVSKCIDNGACEGFQGQFKAMLFILNLNIASKHKMREAIKKTLDDYIDHYPQKRLQGKTCGQVRKELLELSEHTDHPNVQVNRYKKYWEEIGSKKRHRLEQIAAEIKNNPARYGS